MVTHNQLNICSKRHLAKILVFQNHAKSDIRRNIGTCKFIAKILKNFLGHEKPKPVSREGQG